MSSSTKKSTVAIVLSRSETLLQSNKYVLEYSGTQSTVMWYNEKYSTVNTILLLYSTRTTGGVVFMVVRCTSGIVQYMNDLRSRVP
jgi:hypothetical protein